MKHSAFLKAVCLLLALNLAACASHSPSVDENTPPPVFPRSVLVLPPQNNTNEPMATYSYLSTISRPLGEAGYYVYPVAVIDNFLKENGLPTPAEMHSISLNKIDEIIGAESVLYITIERYGQEYRIIQSQTIVEANAELVSVKTGEVLWTGHVREQQSNDNSSSLSNMLIQAVADQIINSSYDAAHKLTRQANFNLISGHKGLPLGPLYDPLAGEDTNK